ncbi:MAG: methyltransferase family protein [Armatimonadota bacterium]
MTPEPPSPIEVSAPPLAGGLWRRWQRFAVRRRTAFTLLILAPLLVFARPAVPLYLLGLASVVTGVAIRVAASGYLLKEEELATNGPFAHTRNPLYLGSLFVALGVLVMSGLWVAFVPVLGFFAFLYYTTILDEEGLLRERFGPDYLDYCARTPRFVPRPRAPAGSWGSFRWDRVWLNKEHVNALGVALACLALAVRPLLSL